MFALYRPPHHSRMGHYHIAQRLAGGLEESASRLEQCDALGCLEWGKECHFEGRNHVRCKAHTPPDAVPPKACQYVDDSEFARHRRVKGIRTPQVHCPELKRTWPDAASAAEDLQVERYRLRAAIWGKGRLRVPKLKASLSFVYLRTETQPNAEES